MSILSRVFDPTRFQGVGRTHNYFEGWYFKIVIPRQNIAYAFIPGISYDAEGNGHAFLQVLNGVEATSAYHRYATEVFRPARDRFHLTLASHEFSAEGIVINLPDLQLALTFGNVHPWEKQALAPGIMGWYGFVPRMQCYHGLVSYYHDLAGVIRINGQEYDAVGGVGYAEKDWGSGFPEAWVWCQSNHLSGETEPASLMASVAKIPWLGSSFTGFLATFLLRGKVHLFTTWARSRVQTEFLKSGEVRLTFSTPDKRLEITGMPAPGGDLASPVTGAAMTGKINESLQAELVVRFWLNDALTYEGQASWAGLEVSERAGEEIGRRK